MVSGLSTSRTDVCSPSVRMPRNTSTCANSSSNLSWMTASPIGILISRRSDGRTARAMPRDMPSMLRVNQRDRSGAARRRMAAPVGAESMTSRS